MLVFRSVISNTMWSILNFDRCNELNLAERLYNIISLGFILKFRTECWTLILCHTKFSSWFELVDISLGSPWIHILVFSRNYHSQIMTRKVCRQKLVPAFDWLRSWIKTADWSTVLKFKFRGHPHMASDDFG